MSNSRCFLFARGLMATAAREYRYVTVEGRRLRISNPHRPLFPDGFTKGQMLDWYRAVAPAILPHLAERPVTLRRFPEGVWEHGWFQTECRSYPAWIPTQDVGFEVGTSQRFCVINELAGLLWAANLASVELHPLLATRDALERPLVLVFDLDPGAPAGLVECCRSALLVRDALAATGARCFPKTSGSKGLHVYVPLDRRSTFDETKSLARQFAARLAAEHPDLVVDVARRSVRSGRVLIDWAQNNRSRSTVAPYSLRAGSRPRVSTPLRWEEVEECAQGGDGSMLAFSPADVLDRFDRYGDLFRPVLEGAQALPAAPA